MTVFILFLMAIIGGFVALLIGVRRWGKSQERVKQLEQTLDDLSTKKEIEREVNNLDDAALLDKLNSWVRKPRK